MKKKSKGYLITAIGIAMIIIGVILLYGYTFLPVYNQYAYIGGVQVINFAGLIIFVSGLIISFRRWIL